MSTTYQRRKAQGLCVECGKPKGDTPYVLCRLCLCLRRPSVVYGWTTDERKTTQARRYASAMSHRDRTPGDARPTRLREGPPLPTGPNLVAHCGAWRVIDRLPWHCPVCQAVLFDDRKAHGEPSTKRS